jgi:poly(glycerol-phosphate) alpha-glucosyltransferase
MLEPWALKNSFWKKQLAGRLFENENLRAAGCLHALGTAEAENFRRYGLRNPIAIIPNGIELSELYPLPDADVITERFPELKDRRRILFLSRLHPKKGLGNLFKAWRCLSTDFRDWCVLIGGSGQPAYEQELRSLVKDFGLEKSIYFLGPIYGEDKKLALAAADGFVLPSFSEGFSVAILEAAAAGLPVLLTRECNFPELASAGGGIETSTELEGIEAGLRQMLALSEEQRNEMGRRGMELVQRSYSWPTIAGQMIEVYRWLLGSGAKPECVV